MEYLEISLEEKKNYIDNLYNCFESGRDFELFLNYFLQKYGFEEVVTTKYVGDKGIDLTCSKSGIDVGGIDTMNYYVQAKRYKSTNKVQAKEIRDLKGSTKYDKNGNVLNNNYINVFVTTSDFTSGAIEEATSNPQNPTILINGERLLNMCIDKGIGFLYQPIFIKDKILSILHSDNNVRTDSNPIIPVSEDYVVARDITANDVRARILIIPQIIRNNIANDATSLSVVINGKAQILNIDKTHRYLGGITQIYKDCGLINEDNMFVQKQSKWTVVDNVIHIIID